MPSTWCRNDILEVWLSEIVREDSELEDMYRGREVATMQYIDTYDYNPFDFGRYLYRKRSRKCGGSGSESVRVVKRGLEERAMMDDER